MSDITVTKRPGKWRVRWALTKKEIRNVIQHPNYLMIMVIPIFVSLVMTIAFPVLNESDDLIVVVYDAGESALAASLQSVPDLIVQTAVSEADVFSNLLEEEATGGLIIPAGFDTAVAAGKTPELTVYVNAAARNSLIAEFKRLMSEQTWNMRYGTAPVQLTWQEENVAAESIFSDGIQAYFYIMLVLLGLVTASITLGSQLIMEEREKGILSSLFASPVEPKDLLVSKAATTILFSLVVAAILTVMNQGWLGDFVVTAVAIFITTLFLVCIALLLGSWGQSSQQCNTYGGIITIVLILPVWFILESLESFGAVTAFIVRLVPTYYFAQTLVYSLAGKATLATAGVNLLILAAFTAVSFILLLWVLQRRPLWYT